MSVLRDLERAIKTLKHIYSANSTLAKVGQTLTKNFDSEISLFLHKAYVEFIITFW